MQLTEEQFNEIQDLSPKPRGNVRWGHRRGLNDILYILKHGCPWRSLPACYGRFLEHGVRADEVLGGAWGVGGGVRAFARSGVWSPRTPRWR